MSSKEQPRAAGTQEQEEAARSSSQEQSGVGKWSQKAARSTQCVARFCHGASRSSQEQPGATQTSQKAARSDREHLGAARIGQEQP